MPNIVYVLTNPAMPGLVKIGMTDRDDVQRRMNELFTTGVPFPFECVIAREIEGREAASIENALHTAFGPYRANLSREFFQIDSQQAEALLQVMHGRDVTPRVDEQLAAASPEDSAAATEFKKRQARTSEDEFLASFSGSGRDLYERVLALGKQEGMQISWATKSFSLYVVSGGSRSIVCYGYAPSAFYGRMYTYFSWLAGKSNVPPGEFEALRKEALDTGLFVPAGRNNEISCHTDRPLDESQIATITQWVWALVEIIRKYTNANQNQG